MNRLFALVFSALAFLSGGPAQAATYGQHIEFGPYFVSGALAAGAKVYHYSAGTETLKNCWSDRAKTTTVAQPLVADSQGVASAFCDGVYQFVIKSSAGTTLYTFDNVAVADQTQTTTGEGAALASASTLILGTDGDFFHVTGTNTISALSGTQTQVVLAFDSALTLTHSGTLILQNSENYTTAAGDMVAFVNEGAGVWREAFRRLATFKFRDTAILYALNHEDFRLTLTTGTPITTADVTAATTLYFSPDGGNRISLYDGTTNWNVRSSAEMSIAVPATTGTVYDVFCYDNAGVPTLELTAWTNDTTRATALTRQDGVLVKSGATTRRYVGSFETTAVSGQTEDSASKRYLWNYYHRVDRPMRVIEATNSWTYTTATYRQANGTTTNQLDFVIGVAEDPVVAHVVAHVSSTTNSRRSVGIGLDSTTAVSSQVFGGMIAEATSSQILQLGAEYRGVPGVGRHVLTWLEYALATGTATWYGDNGGSEMQSGITGLVKG